MVVRTQIAFDSEDHRRARAKAAALGVSLAEYVRRLVARDLESPRAAFDVSSLFNSLFNIGDSGGSDVAAHKDAYLGAASAEVAVRSYLADDARNRLRRLAGSLDIDDLSDELRAVDRHT